MVCMCVCVSVCVRLCAIVCDPDPEVEVVVVIQRHILQIDSSLLATSVPRGRMFCEVGHPCLGVRVYVCVCA